MHAKHRHLSRFAVIGATLLVGIALSGCAAEISDRDSESNSSSSNNNSERPRTSDREESTKTEEPVTGTQQSAFDMRVGDCWNDPDEMSQVSDLEVVPCTAPHDNEVFALFDLEDGSFPGKTEVESLAQTGCELYFEDYVGTSYETSALEIFPVYPTDGSWNNMNDREVVCSVYDMSLAQLFESVRGTGL